MIFVPLTQAVVASGEETGDDAIQRQGFLIRRLRWKTAKLLSTRFLLPVFRTLETDEMHSVILPEEAAGVIGCFDPEKISQGDILQKEEGTGVFVRNFARQNTLFWDFTSPQDPSLQFLSTGIWYTQKENRLFFNQQDLRRLSGDQRHLKVLYLRLPKDERGDLVPDFMIECLTSYATLVILKRDMYQSVRNIKQANMPQIRMMLKEMELNYKTLAKQVMVIQQDLLDRGELQSIPVTLAH